MVRKNYSKTGRSCRVTFYCQPEIEVQAAAICGEFNGWDPNIHPMTRRKDNRFSATLSLPTGQDYKFRYLLDGQHWINDESADDYISNHFGTEDSLIRL